MVDKIKRLATETGIYGVSTILGRFLTFLLVPFYTNVLAPGEYGVVTYVYSIIAFLNVVYGYGMESAYFKYASSKEVGSESQNFSTPFLSLFVSSSVLTGLIVVAAPFLGNSIGLGSGQHYVILYAGWILFFDALTIIPFAALRLDRRPKLFAAIKFTNIAINVAANLILLLVFRTGIEGIFMSGLLASGVTFLMLLPMIAKRFTRDFSSDLWKSLFRFGLPYLPAGLAAMMIQVVDRPILRMLTDDATVGIYQASYRLGIFMMLIVSMFDYAWRPFFLTHASDEDAKPLFARVTTYLVLMMAFVFLALTFFLPDLVRIRVLDRAIIHPAYWSGLGIVPIVMLGYLFLGIYNSLMPGIYIEKKTKYLPPITIAGAVVNVAANFALIPAFGIVGAAWATFASYALMAGALYFVVQQVYPVKYEWLRLVKIVFAATVTFLLTLLPIIASSIHWRISLLILFVLLLYAMRFFSSGEISALRQMTNLRRSEPRVETPPDAETRPPLQ